jgi:predicted lipoprotein with Yx(FWY)xxD motif
MIANTPALGSFLTDGNGRTLYFFANDGVKTSVCNRSCLTQWPAFYTAALSVPRTLDGADFGAVTRPDGVEETSYKGRPLYYFSGDTTPGMTTGNGYLASWEVANVSGIMPVFSPVSTGLSTNVATQATAVQTLSPYGGGSGDGK